GGAFRPARKPFTPKNVSSAVTPCAQFYGKNHDRLLLSDAFPPSSGLRHLSLNLLQPPEPTCCFPKGTMQSFLPVGNQDEPPPESPAFVMKSLRRFLTRVFNSAARHAQEERLREEITEHIALQTEENLRAGLSPMQARRQAMLKFGGVEAVKEDYRAERRLLPIENLAADLRN